MSTKVYFAGYKSDELQNTIAEQTDGTDISPVFPPDSESEDGSAEGANYVNGEPQWIEDQERLSETLQAIDDCDGIIMRWDPTGSNVGAAVDLVCAEFRLLGKIPIAVQVDLEDGEMFSKDGIDPSVRAMADFITPNLGAATDTLDRWLNDQGTDEQATV